MISWADAHRLALVAALRTQRDLGLDQKDRVPVFDVAERLGLVTRFGPLPRLAGAYIAEPDCEPGVLINTRYPLARQRYTAAHEIGHHVLQHETHLDLDTDIAHLDAVPDQEKMAEAFAAWLLMPRQLVMRLKRDGSTSAEEVYRLALRMGTSYEATCRHLVNLRILTPASGDQHLKVRPKTVKVALAGLPPVGIGRSDVHTVRPRDAGARIYASPGDLLVVHAGRPDLMCFHVHIGSLAAPVDADAIGTLDDAFRRFRVVDLPRSNPAARAATGTVAVSVDEKDWTFELVVQPPIHGVSERWFTD